MLLLGALSAAAVQPIDSTAMVHVHRSAPGDLEIGGELAESSAGSTRFVRYEDLLRLPQETLTVNDDTNFRGKTEIGGIPLDQLARIFGKSADMIVAICYDGYRTNYPRDYVNAHHPLLVLRINGQERDHWPPAENGGTMGPFLISHPVFQPSFKVLSHEDEPQIPFGVTRLEFRREAEVFGAIRPHGTGPKNRRSHKAISLRARTASAVTIWALKEAPWPGIRGCSWHGLRTRTECASGVSFTIRHRSCRERRCPRTGTTMMPRSMR